MIIPNIITLELVDIISITKPMELVVITDSPIILELVVNVSITKVMELVVTSTMIKVNSFTNTIYLPYSDFTSSIY